jgi:hypothetical protein
MHSKSHRVACENFIFVMTEKEERGQPIADCRFRIADLATAPHFLPIRILHSAIRNRLPPLLLLTTTHHITSAL